MSKYIEVIGARIHNLKNIDVKIPKNKIVAITGVSGSGKSSLAFDILFEEGMRRYWQSIGWPPEDIKEKPFDLLSGLSPTIAVEQRTTRMVNPRSTVGTKTAILNFLRHLFAIESVQLCSKCSKTLNNGTTCSTCGTKAKTFQAKHFTFNESGGMCLKCKGRGYIREFLKEKLIPDPTKSIKQICKSGSASFGPLFTLVKGLAEAMNFAIDSPYCDLPQEVQDIFLYGSDETMQIKWTSRRFDGTIETKFEGAIPYLHRVLTESPSAYRRNKIEKIFMTKLVCPTCKGYKISTSSQGAAINGKHFGELGTMSIDDLIVFLENLNDQHIKTDLGRSAIKDILQRLKRAKLVGISYLSLYRSLTTLSGGELQRLSLMTHLDAGLDSLVFILDEPSMGMHELEKDNLMVILKELKELGNSLIIVEHDRNIISQADQIIDLGPGAGKLGGEIVFQGSVEDIKHVKKSITGKFMSGEMEIPKKTGEQRRTLTPSTKFLVMQNVTTNNLKNLKAKIPLGIMVGIAGVSGSGKSSLISDTLVPLLQERFTNRNNGEDVEEENNQIGEIKGKLAGWENIKDCIVVTQSPISRVKTSTPTSYIGFWDTIRKIFAKQPLAKEREYNEGHFSFNSEGRCPSCKGAGAIELQISYFTRVDLPCEECNGTRYKAEILDVEYKNKNISEILNLTVSDALEVFKDEERVFNYLKILEEIGMGYITLGQSTTTLSGGEAQRIKLAKELGRPRKRKNTLYVFDEPTAGLHQNDVLKLITLLNKLVEQGNTVLIIEHDVDVLSYMDYLIELGPYGGPKGGKVIATGSPEEIKANKQSKIAPFLEVEG